LVNPAFALQSIDIIIQSTEMVEPLEETRSELVFATEPALSSLELSIPDSGRRSTLVELDEVEVSISFSNQRDFDIDV